MADHLPSFEGYHCLIVPGWQGSGDDHWQTHWQSRLPHTSRTRVGSWQKPELEDWIGALNRSTRRIDFPINPASGHRLAWRRRQRVRPPAITSQLMAAATLSSSTMPAPPGTASARLTGGGLMASKTR